MDKSAPRVLVFSAELDRHDAEICFGRFLARLERRGQVRWEHRSYDDCAPAEVGRVDVAIFCRPRFDPCPALLDACRAGGVPVLVMIDDHWIAAGQDYPERFRGLFTPGDRPLEIFLDAMRRADLTLVYSPLLASDLAPLAQRLLLFPLNIDFDLFPASGLDRPRTDCPVFGYAGSPRIFETSAFHALRQLAERHPDLSLLVFSHRVPEELIALPPGRVRHVPFQPAYASYARTLGELAPDVLVAPLDATRAAAAKCPVKLLDCAAAGAVGVFSRVAPYSHYVRDGETGILVEESESAWLAALDRLVADPGLRGRLAARAAAEIREQFSTDRVLPRFVSLLEAVRRRDWGRLAGP